LQLSPDFAPVRIHLGKVNFFNFSMPPLVLRLFAYAQ